MYTLDVISAVKELGKRYLPITPSAALVWTVLILSVICGFGLLISVGGGMPNLFSGFLGAALGGAAALVAVIASLRSLRRQLAHQEQENAKQRERDGLVRLMAAFGALEGSIEQGNFADHRKGRRDRTMDGVELATAQLHMQLLYPDPPFLYVVRLWQWWLSQRAYHYWRLRDGDVQAKYEYETSNALSHIGSMAGFVAEKLAAYGRSTDQGARKAIVRELAEEVSRVGLRKSRWDVPSNRPFRADDWIWKDIQHPPVG
ncbi:hypothetical protein DFO47_11244 [Arthrobacter sp. AG258]|nr:hypothetical protein DFO47_11244 [Arthrobacter sp. AG258]